MTSLQKEVSMGGRHKALSRQGVQEPKAIARKPLSRKMVPDSLAATSLSFRKTLTVGWCQPVFFHTLSLSPYPCVCQNWETTGGQNLTKKRPRSMLTAANAARIDTPKLPIRRVASTATRKPSLSKQEVFSPPKRVNATGGCQPSNSKKGRSVNEELDAQLNSTNANLHLSAKPAELLRNTESPATEAREADNRNTNSALLKSDNVMGGNKIEVSMLNGTAEYEKKQAELRRVPSSGQSVSRMTSLQETRLLRDQRKPSQQVTYSSIGNQVCSHSRQKETRPSVNLPNSGCLISRVAQVPPLEYRLIEVSRIIKVESRRMLLGGKLRRPIPGDINPKVGTLGRLAKWIQTTMASSPWRSCRRRSLRLD